MKEFPRFFNYNDGKIVDTGYENLQDFFLSWTLRCAEEQYSETNDKLNKYAKKIMYTLLFGENSGFVLEADYSRYSNFKVLSVKTQRQLEKIDLLAEVEIEIDGKKEEYLLNIENKWYTTVREGQLTNYISKLSSSYDLDKFKLISIVIYCDYEIINKNKSQIKLCTDNSYKFTNIGELGGLLNEGITGNYLFDEYWFYWSGRN